MDFQDLMRRAVEIRQRYAQWEQAQYGRSWTDEELTLGFVGDLGDLVKLVQAQNAVRNIPNMNDKLAHELADCLWSVIVLSQAYHVDLEAAFLQTMDELEKHLTR